MKRRGILEKRAALELSIGTVVIIVLAMSMLILGLVLVRNIFTGAKYNIDQLNDKVTDEINRLFTEEKEIVMYLANRQAEVKQGEDFGVAFGIKNTKKGVASEEEFSYEITANDPDLEKACGVTAEEAQDWLYPGRAGSFSLAPGEVYTGLVRINVPKGSTLCTIRYNLEVKQGDSPYAFELFDVTVE
jgi:hypothetical protein